MTFSIAANVENFYWGVFQIQSVDTSGTNGSNAIPQNITNVGNGATASATLGTFISMADATLGAVYYNNPGASIVGTGFTKIGEISSAHDLTVEFSNNAISTVPFTIQSSNWCEAAIELKTLTAILGPGKYW